MECPYQLIELNEDKSGSVVGFEKMAACSLINLFIIKWVALE